MSDNNLDAVFYISLSTIVAGTIGLMVRYCYRSRCDDISCGYGCLKVHRVIEHDEPDRNYSVSSNI